MDSLGRRISEIPCSQKVKTGAFLTDERKKIEFEIQKNDQAIDELVYKLYELTDEEIKIIEKQL